MLTSISTLVFTVDKLFQEFVMVTQKLKAAQRQAPCFFHWLYLCINNRQPFSVKGICCRRLREN
jgi:hypothetical protein